MTTWLHRAAQRALPAKTVSSAKTAAATARRRTPRVVAVVLALTLAAVGTIVADNATPAYAVDYPTWQDVENARASESATVAQIAEITALIASLRAEVERTQAEAEAKGVLAQEADQAFQEAALKAQKLTGQADDAEKLAAQSQQQAGEIVAQQYRSGNGDVSANLFVNATQADDLLYSYGMADKFTEQTAGIYQKALQDQNTAQALADQADVAQSLLEELKVAAEAALAEATAAADAAAAAVAAQEENEANLNAQLTVLSERRAATEADYNVGVQVRAEEERQRQAAAAAAAQAAAAADAAARAAAAAAGAVAIANTGWAKPAYGGITSGYGNRLNPYSHVWRLHAGTDIGAACGRPIYAAYAGTVIYSGWYGSYGNFIQIDHANGISTAYGHIVNGGLLASDGQRVEAGQLIAYVGTTGGSTGCHLHFETRVNNVATDAVPFMRAQGITLG
ncbi:murein DD-endopeptidase MepM/ murein hydrolase activator NlpD [Conyzicola lurida]|uniref:Murein DD-endopeptidase MepM/ murein hydrolase activator NlpD n=1 Tax=Conyzicola lurida TaxID=1172621 RepID=A0A841ATB3_9MICO|nr:M23 family metallopeptidase [Conyzicola lurida]MBB5845182.1 murein DD-endopeptidase MepM/ murein hydrolase activator NlpD [Conyzicola lurida]